MPIQVACGSCAKRFQAGNKLAGRRVKCPVCEGFIDVPVPQPVALAGTGVLGLLDQEEVPTERRCPKCSRPLGVAEVFCVACGYDARTGTRIQPAAAQAPAASPVSGFSEAASSVGTVAVGFVRGCLCSLVAVSIGTAMWYYVAFATGYELGLIAWGLGILAGVGMRLGYARHGDVAGITAAVMACAGIFIAKWMIFSTLFLPLVDHLKVMGKLGSETTTCALFFQTSFGIMDGIFILLAFFTAYKTGSGRTDE